MDIIAHLFGAFLLVVSMFLLVYGGQSFDTLLFGVLMLLCGLALCGAPGVPV